MSSWFNAEKLREAAMARAFRLFSDPRVSKVLTDPKVMAVLMKAIQLASRAQQGTREGLGAVARMLRLATAEDVSTLRAEVRKLEMMLETLEAQLGGEGMSQPGRSSGRPSA